jgi:DNA end-binding protein Ku
MAGRKKPKPRKREHTRPRNSAIHAFWSGTLSFGLVNVPVLLFPASRHTGIRLRLLSPEGSLLERRFFCPRDGKEVPPDEIARGYELDDGSYILVEDRELDALEPAKSREVDLREFVDLSEIGPAFFERGYYLSPLAQSTKAYRLLAEVMEKTRRAGIATFVMRQREYLVAIFAQHGILCAETLRLHDEIRDPETIGLPAPFEPPRQRVAAFERSIDAIAAKSFSRDELVDPDDERLRAIIEKKKQAGKDLVRTATESEQIDVEQDGEGGGDIDLLETIRQSLRHEGNGWVTHRKAAARSHRGAHGKTDGSPLTQGKKRDLPPHKDGRLPVHPPSGKTRRKGR